MALVVNVGRPFTHYRVKGPAAIVVEGAAVKKVVRGWLDHPDALNFREYKVAPGFVDTRIHGCYGYDASPGRVGDVLGIVRSLPRHGATGFLAATVTLPPDKLSEAVEAVKSAREQQEASEPQGARVLGVYLEDPCISSEMRGAQNPEYIRKPYPSELEELYGRSGGLLKVITVAPEVEGA